MNDCTLWNGPTNKQGYGRIWRGKKKVSVHRLAYCEANGLDLGEIQGMFVLHSCDVPSCYNPDHLFLGTHQDNMDDRRAKGRDARGEELPQAKLTDTQVEEIRETYVPGMITQAALAKQYGVSHQQVSRIVNNQTRRLA